MVLARDARGRTPELVALDLGHVDCAGLFYNMDIHSYTPKQTDSGGSSDDDEPRAGQGEGRRERGHDVSRSEDDDDGGAHDADPDAREYLHSQRNGEAGATAGATAGARASTTSLRQGFDQAVAAARRASSLSMQQQQQQPEEEEQGQEGPRRHRGSASSSSFPLGERVTRGDKAAQEEGEREGEGQREGYTGGSSSAEPGENAERYTEGYDDGEEGHANNAEGERADWEWSETEGWIRAGEGGGTGAPAGDEAPLDEEHENRRQAADNFGDGEEGYYPGHQGYGEPRESGSYSDWQQQPYYSTSQQGDSHGGSYDGTDQGDDQQQQQQQYSYSGRGEDGSYDTAHGAGNDISDNINPRQEDQRNVDFFEQAGWEGPGDGRGGDSAELLQETGAAAAAAAAAGGDDDIRGLFEAALGEGRGAPGTDPDKEKPGEWGQNVAGGGSANHLGADGNKSSSDDDDDDDNDGREQERSTAAASHGNSARSGRDTSSSSGWGSAFAAVKASNRWMSLLDTSSGNVYYQNERSGQTEWELPEGAVVVYNAPEET